MKQEEVKTLKEKREELVIFLDELLRLGDVTIEFAIKKVIEQDKEFINDLKEEIKNSKVMLKKQIPFIWDIIDKLSGFD